MPDEKKEDLWIVKGTKHRKMKGLDQTYESPMPVSRTEADTIKGSLSRQGFKVEVIPANQDIPREIKK